MIDVGVIVCMVMGIAQLWKKLKLNTNWIPVLNVLVALLLSLVWFDDLQLLFRLQQGLMIGLSASGAYDVCNSVKNKF